MWSCDFALLTDCNLFKKGKQLCLKTQKDCEGINNNQIIYRIQNSKSTLNNNDKALSAEIANATKVKDL